MSDAPDRIAAWPDFDGQYSVTGQWSTNTHPENAVAYVRADLSDALLREAMAVLAKAQDQSCEGFCEQLPQADTYTPDMDLDCATCFLRPTLAKLRAHLEGDGK